MFLFIIALLVVFTFYFPFVALAIAGIYTALVCIGYIARLIHRSICPVADVFVVTLAISSLTYAAFNNYYN